MTSDRQKKAQNPPSVLTLLTWKFASGHSGVHFFDMSASKNGLELMCFVHFDLKMCFEVHFFDISTSKSGPNRVCFVHFDLKMRFAPQRRTLCRHPSQSALELRRFIHFDFEMCFAPQRRAIFHVSSRQMALHPPL